MKIMGHKKSAAKKQAAHKLRNQVKIMGQKKSAAKAGNSQAKKPNKDYGPQEE